MSARDDLGRLSDAQLATLGNVGLLKRARREVEAGRGPTLTLELDGTLVGESRDGAVSRIGRDLGGALGVCSCGATRACRHRVATVLQYQREHAASELAPWDPGGFEDEALEARLGARRLTRARALVEASVAVRVHPGATPAAELPNATVSFWAPDALHLARCDCGESPCVHLALAVWAFRAAPTGGLVVLGGASPTLERPGSLDRVEPALAELVGVGLATLEDARVLEAARIAVADEGCAWLQDALEELERQKERYDRRSTLFRGERVVRCVAELLGRVRAARSGSLPAPLVLGTDTEGSGGRSDRVRLIGVGAETEADGARRIAKAYFVEPISGTVLALHHEWDFEGRVAPSGVDMGKLYASSRRSLADLSSGYVVARGARRRANGLLDLSRARSIQPSSAPGGEAWGEVAAPIRVRSLEAHARRLAQEPPAMLGPRLLGRDVHVLEVATLTELGYSPAHQEVMAWVADEAGVACRIRVPHRDVSPGAPDAVYRALAEGCRRLSGRLRVTQEGWELRVLALVSPGGHLVVPDLAPLRPVEKAVRPELFSPPPAPGLFAELSSVVERGVHQGHPAVRAPLRALSERFSEAGLARTAALLARAASQGAGAFLDLVLVSEIAHVAEARRAARVELPAP